MSGFGTYATDLRFELLKDVGHFPATEVPETVADRALRFFAGAKCVTAHAL